MSAESAWLDQAKPVRAGETFDLERLGDFIRAKLLPELSKLEVKQFPSGHSNLTYLIEAQTPAGPTVEYVLRRPPLGNKVKSAHDMGREFTILSAIRPAFSKVPAPLAHCEDEAILGAPFYLMERLSGMVLRRKLPAQLSLEPARLHALAGAFIETFAEIHELPYERLGLATLGRPEGYVERQVLGWAKRYEDAKTDDIPAMIELATWLTANQPKHSAAALIHNDFKYDNLLFDPASFESNTTVEVRGVLDWEMSTIGDPLMDLGTALAYWITASDPAPFQTYTFGPTNLPGGPTREELLALYDKRRPGLVPDDMRFYYIFALFKNAVVAQQIYRRFKLGLTQDERFGMMIFAVGMLASTGLEATSGAFLR